MLGCILLHSESQVRAAEYDSLVEWCCMGLRVHSVVGLNWIFR